LRLGDGTQELAKKMKKRGSKVPLCQNLAMAPTCTHKQQNKKKKKGELGLPFY
jgi:hypothetical protein